MKKLTALLLTLVMILSLCACAGNGDAPETTTVPEEPEMFVTSTIIKDGASDYVIVHDGTTATIDLAMEIKNTIQIQFGVQLEVASASSREESGCEIVLGNCRAVAEKTQKKLTGEFDFALKVEENKLVLCAKDAISYLYLSEYLKREVFVKSETEGLVLDSDDNIIYSSSGLTQMNYIDYLLEEDTYFELGDIFAWAEYKNEDTTLPYRIYVPFNYTPDKSYPLFINLHGAGSRGNDNTRQLGFIDPVLKMQDVPLDDAIMIFPQCPADNKWVDTPWDKGSYSLDEVGESNEIKALIELIAQLQETYSVDENRIYACGVSMGAYGVWNLMMNHPELLTAGIMMCGAADPSKAEILKNIPIWTIHGDQDPTVPVTGTREIVTAIQSAGGEKIQYTELPGCDHNVWDYTYSNQEIFAWLFSQVKA